MATTKQRRQSRESAKERQGPHSQLHRRDKHGRPDGNGGHDHHAKPDARLLRSLPGLAASMTFATMVRANLRAIPNFRDLQWLFPALCHRKDQAALTDSERSRYLCALNMLEADGTLGQLVDIHHEMHMQHTNARLLPWHRVFLYLLEEALHNYHPDVCVPYWDWTRPEEQHFPAWLAGVLPTVHTPTRTITVVRAPGSDAIMDPWTYTETDTRDIQTLGYAYV